MRIYIVGAEINDDDFHNGWLVRAFTDRASADNLKNNAQRRAREMWKTMAGMKKARNFGVAEDFRATAKNEFDPNMQWSLGGLYPSYYVIETELE